MPLLTGLTPDGLEVPVQVKPDGKLVAEGLTGPAGGVGPQGPAGPQGGAGAIGNTAALPGLTPVGDPDSGLFSPGADQIAVSTGALERLRVDASGRLLVGTSIARVFDSSTSTLTPMTQIETPGAGAALSITRSNTSSTGPGLFFGKSRGAAAGGNTIVQDSDKLGTIFFEGTDNTNLVEAATIAAEVDGTPGGASMPGRLVFGTTPNGQRSPVVRMTIKSTGIINFANVPIYTDIAAAQAGGLVASDVFRKTDGTLMIVT
jgi:hypothetical protein